MSFVSVLTWCYSRQEMLDITLPLLMQQEGIDYEVIVGRGPEIKVPQHWTPPIIKTTVTEKCAINKAYNQMMACAKGDILLITQCDMQFNSPFQIKRMLDKWHGRNMVTEKFFKNGGRDPGLYLQCCLVAKADIEKVGGWCEEYDDPGMAAHEDADLIARLLKSGLDLDHTEASAEEGVYHIEHPKPDYHSDPVILARLAKAKALFDSRNKEGVHHLYTKQFIRHMMSKKVAI